MKDPVNPLSHSLPTEAVFRARTLRPALASAESQSIYPVVNSALNATPELISPLEDLEAWHNQSRGMTRTTCRWSLEKLASLSIYWPSCEQDALFKEACKSWELVSAGRLEFRYTLCADNANITVSFDDTPVTGRAYELGHTDREVSSQNEILTATITLMTSPVIDRSLSGKQLEQRWQTTMLHELGHALGLEHSTNPKDIMHHRGWKNRFLSPGDIEQFQAVYCHTPNYNG